MMCGPEAEGGRWVEKVLRSVFDWERGHSQFTLSS